MKITAAILTGGKNSRMGGNIKSLAKICERRIIDMQTDILKRIFDDIMICGKNTGITGYRIFEDKITNIGPISGILNALNNAKTDYIFVFSGDTPFLNKALIIDMIKYCEKLEPQVLIPSHKSGLEPLHAVYHKSILNEIQKQIDNSNYKLMDCCTSSDTHRFIVNQEYNPEKSFFNVNTPKDLEKAKILCKTN